MQRIFSYVLVGGVSFLVAGLLVSKRLNARHAAEVARFRVAEQAEAARWQEAIDEARREMRRTPPPSAVPSPSPVGVPAVAPLTAGEIIAKLEGLAPTGGKASPRTLREAVYWLEELSTLGPAALPAIQECLARYQDFELDISLFTGRSGRDEPPMDFAVPPSLRFGLFDVARRIGGAEAEKILAAALERTGRGVEVAYLARVLEQMAPGKYRQRALAVTHGLLDRGIPAESTSPLDRNHRDYLFGVLALFGDVSYAQAAQSQLITPNNQVDRSTLRYLQQVLGAQAVPIVAQAYQNPMLTNSAAKEPLARLALNFVGADPVANRFYEQAINDPVLTRSHRKNLIEDLNQDGFADTRNLTVQDLSLIENRLKLIEQLSTGAMDSVNAGAFAEAYKDLVNMRTKVTGQPPR